MTDKLTTRPEVRQQCECGSWTFAVFYDPVVQGCHTECTECGKVFHG